MDCDKLKMIFGTAHDAEATALAIAVNDVEDLALLSRLDAMQRFKGDNLIADLEPPITHVYLLQCSFS